jgi:FKBP-type peptidyl-prolyl cis-trans isomerase
MKGLRIFLIPIVGMLLNACNKNPGIDQTPSQFTKDTTAISSYLKQNNIGATEFPSGAWFIIDSAAEGIRPTFKDSIKLKYSARLLADNSILDQSTKPKHFVMDSLLTAIQVVLTEFQAGSKGRIFLPSAYTRRDNWIFQFQLADVKDYQLKIDNAIIDSYLSTHSINAVRDASGLRYTIDTLKTGNKVFFNDEVLVNYVAKNLSNDATVDSGNSVFFQVSSLNLILGWRIALQKMQEGSSFTFYIPSRLAYGAQGNGNSIKPNTNLIFSIKVLKVIHH